MAFVCALVLVVMGMSATQTQATDWVVGGLTQKWNFLHAEDVKTWYNTDWAANNTFKTGDNLSMSPTSFPLPTCISLSVSQVFGVSVENPNVRWANRKGKEKRSLVSRLVVGSFNQNLHLQISMSGKCHPSK